MGKAGGLWRILFRSMLDRRKVVSAVTNFIRENPQEVERGIRSAFGLRFGVPLAAFRWLVQETAEDADAIDLIVEAEPPGLRVAATFEKMETRLRGSAVVFVNRVLLSGDEIRFEVRLEQVGLQVLSSKKTQLSALIRSGALDLSKPGNLIDELPGMPSVIVEAYDNRLVIDLMRSPKFRNNRMLRHAIGLLSSLVTVHGIQTESDHLDVVFRALPKGTLGAAGAIQEHVVEPGLRRVWNRFSRSAENGRMRKLLSAVAGGR
jgi:hypothetical protein